MDQIVTPLEFHRMVFGDQPPLYFVEIVIRTLIIYAYSMLLLRWLGSRTIGQLSTIEFLLVIALGSAVGDPMFYPNVPLLHCLAVITLVILFNKGLDVLVARVRKTERFIDGPPVEIIRDGIVDHEHLHNILLGQAEFFQQLRLKGVTDIGHVYRAYLEPNGLLSVFNHSDAESRHGLRIVPAWEVEPPETLCSGATTNGRHDLACQRCAQPLTVQKQKTVPPCPRCKFTSFSVVG